jgi:hypothetical protein
MTGSRCSFFDKDCQEEPNRLLLPHCGIGMAERYEVAEQVFRIRGLHAEEVSRYTCPETTNWLMTFSTEEGGGSIQHNTKLSGH